jgi:hypothetical protein
MKKDIHSVETTNNTILVYCGVALLIIITQLLCMFTVFRSFRNSISALSLVVFAIALVYQTTYYKQPSEQQKRLSKLHLLVGCLLLIGLGVLLNVIDKIIERQNGFIDLVFRSLTILALAVIAIRWLCNIPKLNRGKKALDICAFAVLLVIGLLTIGVGIRDAIVIAENGYADYDAYLYSLHGTFDFKGLFIPQGIRVFRYWSILQTFGVVGLITWFFIRLKKVTRLVICITAFVIYALYYKAYYNALFVDELAFGGVLGAVPWGCIALLATVILDLYCENNFSAIEMLIFLLFGAALSFVSILALGITNAFSHPSRMLVSLTTFLLIYLILKLFSGNGKAREDQKDDTLVDSQKAKYNA